MPLLSRILFRLKRCWWVLGASSVIAVLAGWLRFAGQAAAELPAPCREIRFEETAYIVCEVRTDEYRIDLRLADKAGKPFGSLKRAAAEHPVILASNAGMYHEDLSPVGLFVEEGAERTPLNRGDGEGNFFLKPNGVFFIETSGKPGVLETEAYASAHPEVEYATQSGPMLVIDGTIHPRFQPDGTSRFIRNGVGVRDATVILAVSRTPVSLGAFARLFRDALDCRNALFLDGAVSAFHDGERYLVGGGYPAGPILAVTEIVSQP